MSARRRALVLIGLALVLGALAASDVAGREAALRRRLGPVVPVVVARHGLEAGASIAARDLALRRVPARFAPAGGFADARQVEGLHVTAPVPAGADLTTAVVADDAAASGAPVGRGERVAEVVAVGSEEAVGPGAHVDVLVTRDGRAGSPGTTTLALEDVEVVAATPAAPVDDAGQRRLAVGLRVTLRQAVFLAAAQAFAREVRILARAAGDSGRSRSAMTYDDRLVTRSSP